VSISILIFQFIIVTKYYLHIPSIPVFVPDSLNRLIIGLVLRYRKKRYGFAFRRIKLTQGKYAIVDPEDFDNLNQYKWCIKMDRYTYYAQRRGIGRMTIYMHKQIMPPTEGFFVDHINHRGFDNRRANLRLATRSQNNCNRRRRNCCDSLKFRGVFRDKTRGKWMVCISCRGKHIYLGRFDNEIQAAKAYDEAAKKYHGDFAVLNFGSSTPAAGGCHTTSSDTRQFVRG
jgi:hypothetical protein